MRSNYSVSSPKKINLASNDSEERLCLIYECLLCKKEHTVEVDAIPYYSVVLGNIHPNEALPHLKQEDINMITDDFWVCESCFINSSPLTEC